MLRRYQIWIILLLIPTILGASKPKQPTTKKHITLSSKQPSTSVMSSDQFGSTVSKIKTKSDEQITKDLKGRLSDKVPTTAVRPKPQPSQPTQRAQRPTGISNTNTSTPTNFSAPGSRPQPGTTKPPGGYSGFGVSPPQKTTKPAKSGSWNINY